METTLKVSKETKDRILALPISEKGKSFDMLINELINYYQRNTKHYKKDYAAWKKRDTEYNKLFEQHKKDLVQYNLKKKKNEQEREVFLKLLKWAKSQGFKS